MPPDMPSTAKPPQWSSRLLRRHLVSSKCLCLDAVFFISPSERALSESQTSKVTKCSDYGRVALLPGKQLAREKQILFVNV